MIRADATVRTGQPFVITKVSVMVRTGLRLDRHGAPRHRAQRPGDGLQAWAALNSEVNGAIDQLNPITPNACRIAQRMLADESAPAAAVEWAVFGGGLALALMGRREDVSAVAERGHAIESRVDSAGSEATARHRRERAAGIVKLWTSPTIAPIAGTRWAAYNAVTEYLDHVVPVRGARTASDASAARALRNITTAGSSGSLKARAFRMLQTL